MSTTTNTTQPVDDSSHREDDHVVEDIWYFGYGPLVHPAVRQRRGIKVLDEQPAVLRDHRLTFAFAGVASVVKQTGWDIHGIVMRCECESDWDKLKEQETGFYAASVDVFPYRKLSNFAYASKACPMSGGDPLSPENDGSDEEDDEDIPPIRAFCFVMEEFDKEQLDRPIQKLPQERYLRLIAAGMYQYDGDEDYIEGEILGVPFSPSRKPDEWLTFPNWNHNEAHGGAVFSAADRELPKISFERYKEFCRQSAFLSMGNHGGLNNASMVSVQSASTSSEDKEYTSLCFIVGKWVIWVPKHDAQHSGARWLRKYGFTKEDVSYILHTFVIDPDIKYCETPEEVTPQVQAWAENQLVISVAQGLDAYRALELVDSPEQESSDLDIVLARMLQSSQGDAILAGANESVSSFASVDSNSNASPRPRGRTRGRQLASNLLNVQNAFKRAGNRMRTRRSSTTAATSGTASVTSARTLPVTSKEKAKSASLSPTRKQRGGGGGSRKNRWSLQLLNKSAQQAKS